MSRATGLYDPTAGGVFLPADAGREGEAMLATYDLDSVRRFTADLRLRTERCANGEGMVCDTVEAELVHQAGLACEFAEGVRGWAGAVFAGWVPFDPATEAELRAEGGRLLARAAELLAGGRQLEARCQMPDAVSGLGRAAWELEDMLATWVSPRPAVGRGPRLALTAADAAAARPALDALPPLPADWLPADPRQARRLHQTAGR